MGSVVPRRGEGSRPDLTGAGISMGREPEPSGILSLCLLPQLSCTKPELPIQRGRTKGWRCTVSLHL